MPAIFAQHGLRQTAPADKPVDAKPEAPRRGRVVSDKTKRLIALWSDESKPIEDIAAELGYANVGSVYQLARYHNLPYRTMRQRKGTV